MVTFKTTSQRAAAGASILVSVAACAGTSVPVMLGGRTNPPTSAHHRPAPATSPIRHVVIVIQENRSLNNLFNGYPGATTSTTAPISTGGTVNLQPVGLEVKNSGTEHFLSDFLVACNGTGTEPGTNCQMNGFDLEKAKPLQAFDYVPATETAPLWAIAKQYVLDNNDYQSQVDASFAGHQYFIASQAGSAVNIPIGTWGCGSPSEVDTITPQRTLGAPESPCFDYLTLGDELDAAHLTWRYYAGSAPRGKDGGAYSAYRAVNHIRYGPDWTQDMRVPASRFLSDIAKGSLAKVTWVTPAFVDSDHPGSLSTTGPSWVASIVNAVGQSRLWNSTIIFITWDDWGGFYDPVPPPFIDADGLGFRVPLLCVSPYAFQGVVNNTQHESTSILKYVETLFGLPSLTARDAQATPADVGCTNPSQTTPRPFNAILAPYDREYFLRRNGEGQPPDDDGGF